MTVRALTLPAAVVYSLLAGVLPASAHSFPEQESPPAGATLSQPPPEITIQYDVPIEKLFASLQVLNSAGQDEVAGKPEVSADGSKLSVPVNKLAPGQYIVRWSVVCIDTHRTQGSYSFTVEGPHS